MQDPTGKKRGSLTWDCWRRTKNCEGEKQFSKVNFTLKKMVEGKLVLLKDNEKPH